MVCFVIQNKTLRSQLCRSSSTPNINVTVHSFLWDHSSSDSKFISVSTNWNIFKRTSTRNFRNWSDEDVELTCWVIPAGATVKLKHTLRWARPPQCCCCCCYHRGLLGQIRNWHFLSACEESVYKVVLVIHYKDSAADGIKHQHLPS